MQMDQDYSTFHRICILIDWYVQNLIGLGPWAMGLSGLGLGWTWCSCAWTGLMRILEPIRTLSMSALDWWQFFFVWSQYLTNWSQLKYYFILNIWFCSSTCPFDMISYNRSMGIYAYYKTVSHLLYFDGYTIYFHQTLNFPFEIF